MRLPDFIVAGVRRCGTTWLHQCLKEHPEIALPAATKELFFFDRYWERGIGWYERYFEGDLGGKTCGEVSPTYFSAPQAPGRIKSVLPDVKLVFALRSPLERVISLYHHLHLSGDIKTDLRVALDTYPELVNEGFYATHLERFREQFAADRMFVFVQEDVKDERALAPLFSFLGVRDDFRPSSTHKRINERREARAKLPALLATRMSRALHRSGLHRPIALAKAVGADKLFIRRQSPESTTVPIDVAHRIHEIYQEDVRRLGDMLGRDLDQVWKHRAAIPGQ